MTPAQVVDDLAEAVGLLELEDVIFYEVNGQRRDGFGDELAFEGDETESPDWTMNVLTSDSDSSLAIRGQLSTETPQLVISVDAAVVFSKREPVVLGSGVIRSFIDNVAMVALFPYHREAVNDVSMRLGHPITLSLLRRRLDGTIAGLDEA